MNISSKHRSALHFNNNFYFITSFPIQSYYKIIAAILNTGPGSLLKVQIRQKYVQIYTVYDYNKIKKLLYGYF